MDRIKTLTISPKRYPHVNREDTTLHFEISRLEEAYTKRQGKENLPHRHDFYTVIILKKAKGQHIIDFNAYDFIENRIFFVSPGQVHQVIEREQSFGFAILFSTQFLLNNNIPLSFIEDLNLFNDYGHSPPLIVDSPKLQQLSMYATDMINIHQSNIKFKEQAIGAYLKLLLIQCNNVCTLPKDNPQFIEAGHNILKNFKEAVEQNYHHWHASTKYAAYLNITPDHLNKTIKSLIGKTAKEYIQTRRIIAAKRMLYFTNLSNKEIGYELGFSEASNFSSFFKKNTKMSPSEFRKTR